MFRNLGNGAFEEIEQAGEGITTSHSSRGCAFGDFDNDGDLDVLIVNMNEPPSLLRNDVKPEQNWLKIKSGRGEVESQCDRGPGCGSLRDPGAGAGGPEPVQLLLL